MTFFGTSGASTESPPASEAVPEVPASSTGRRRGRGAQAERQATPTPDSRGVVVCGSDRTMLRVVTELVSSGEEVTAIVNPASRHIERIAELGAQVMGVRVVRESVLRRAGIDTDGKKPSTARALVLLDADDVHNVHTALTARDMDENLRIVVQMVNPRIGAQLHQLLGDCVVISGPSLAAPAFVADALEDDELTWLELGGRRMVAGPAELIREKVTVLADTTSSATPELLPLSSADPAGDIVLGTGVRHLRRKRDVRRTGWVMATRDVLDRRVRVIAAVMALLVVIGTALTHWIAGVEWLRALYLVMGAVTSAGIEDDVFANAQPWAKVAAVVVQLTGIVLVALLTAVIVDSLIGARLSRVIGGVRGRPRNHVIVCGLGTVGARVLEILAERGVAVVGVEHDEEAPGVQTAHRLRIPLVMGDSSQEETLRLAGAPRAQAVLAITNGDITNLETAMVVRDLNPDARITMRMFDHDLAHKVERMLGLGHSRSVSMLVAPAIAAAVANRRTQATVPAGRRVLLLTEVTVERDSVAVGRRLGELDEAGGLRVLACQTGTGWDWSPPFQQTLVAGTKIAVAGTRSGLARLLLATRAPHRPGRSERIGP
ncbi:TrkA-N domain protein [Kribbella flavida DSM 17836]|uniref:TrkA-N domain protein n=1 Tax=Kribbella flavida (strain DSM 17836 / JCM 10339 / NBRC 14399) TaxID=479435 RepID=D2Q246_KRIFD|nr:NAD-binding protein [Kribbella flavida]ADB33992.1 TrkA-N domain protein [Kribbella flavida DSM 17836]